MSRQAGIRTRLSPAEAYERFLPLAYRMADRFKGKYPRVRSEDILDESVSILGVLCAEWDREGSTYFYDGRVSPSTWMWHNIYWFLTTFCQRNQPKYLTFTAIEPDPQRPVEFTAKVNRMDGLLRELGEDARTVVMTIVEAPAEIASGVRWHQGRNAWHRVWKYLAGQGWEVERISKAWKEVEVAL